MIFLLTVSEDNEQKAQQVKKKKSLKDRIAEKEEKRRKELEEKKLRVMKLLVTTHDMSFRYLLKDFQIIYKEKIQRKM